MPFIDSMDQILSRECGIRTSPGMSRGGAGVWLGVHPRVQRSVQTIVGQGETGRVGHPEQERLRAPSRQGLGERRGADVGLVCEPLHLLDFEIPRPALQRMHPVMAGDHRLDLAARQQWRQLSSVPVTESFKLIRH